MVVWWNEGGVEQDLDEVGQGQLIWDVYIPQGQGLTKTGELMVEIPTVSFEAERSRRIVDALEVSCSGLQAFSAGGLGDRLHRKDTLARVVGRT